MRLRIFYLFPCSLLFTITYPNIFTTPPFSKKYSMSQDTEVIKQELSRVFFTKFRTEHDGDIRYSPNDTAYIESGRFTLGEIIAVQVEGDEIAFRFTLTVKGANRGDEEKRIIPKAKFSYKESITVEDPDIGFPPGGGEIKGCDDSRII